MNSDSASDVKYKLSLRSSEAHGFDFATANAFLLVSINQSYYQGNKFKSLVNLINKKSLLT